MDNEEIFVGGVVVPLVVPILDDDGSIDFEGLEILVEWLVNNGVNGLFVAGTTGRASYFTARENANICRTVSKVAKGRVTVYAGCLDSGIHRILENSEMMANAGADILVTTLPYYLSYSVCEAQCDLERIIDKISMPMILYNIPELVRISMEPAWVAEMAEHENVVGYKDSSGDINHLLEVLRLTKDKDFKVFIGKELLVYKALTEGASGVVSSFSNSMPELFVKIYEFVTAGEKNAARMYQDKINRMVENFVTLPGSQSFSKLMFFLEQGLSENGIKLKLH